MHFIYVMSKADKDTMVSLGYPLLKSDRRNRVWVFQNKDTATYACEDELAGAGVQFVLSDRLTF